ncbi:conserved protein of unknown function [Ectopseudomonas oleovorans]|uniref:Uncharacterized protein n=1 Tax=Ectopseudomonas oleovorans TaxID=301 RepID=A0A653BAS5_ECTOL|nr:conserved protein of unknown function [Pseudomonas oleovorans]
MLCVAIPREFLYSLGLQPTGMLALLDHSAPAGSFWPTAARSEPDIRPVRLTTSRKRWHR